MLICIRILPKKHNIEIKWIRLDNSGENRSLHKECDKANLGITFEFTAPGTPQQISVAERRIPKSIKKNSGVKSFPQQQSWTT